MAATNWPNGYDYDPLNDDTAKIVAHTPYPCTFDGGLVTGTVGEFQDGYAQFEHKDGGCRDDADVCTFTVTW